MIALQLLVFIYLMFTARFADFLREWHSASEVALPRRFDRKNRVVSQPSASIALFIRQMHNSFRLNHSIQKPFYFQTGILKNQACPQQIPVITGNRKTSWKNILPAYCRLAPALPCSFWFWPLSLPTSRKIWWIQTRYCRTICCWISSARSLSATLPWAFWNNPLRWT